MVNYSGQLVPLWPRRNPSLVTVMFTSRFCTYDPTVSYTGVNSYVYVWISAVVMDIIGLLPFTPLGKQYVLVICDYATRYLEAILLHSTDVSHIAEELMGVFARVGIPSEIHINTVIYWVHLLNDRIRTLPLSQEHVATCWQQHQHLVPNIKLSMACIMIVPWFLYLLCFS